MKQAYKAVIPAVLATLVLSTAVPTLALSNAAVAVSEDSTYGNYLTDENGMSLYAFNADKTGKSSCYDTCSRTWPPLLTIGDPQAGNLAEQSLLGTVKRKDGQLQVTYDGKPLYYFVEDKAPGDTAGQSVKGYGAKWDLVKPNGQVVHG